MEQILWMQSQGLTEAEIARALQIGRSVVEYALEVYGTIDKGSVLC